MKLPKRPAFLVALERRLDPHYVLLTTIVLFLFTAFVKWRGFVQVHEAMYFMGPHRLVDPEILAKDLSWGRIPPTTFLYDHMIAPFWNSLGDLGLAHAGGILYWGLTAWSLALLGRLMRVPAWALVIGYALWLLSGQTLVSCGRPIEGFQPKALSYPLFYFSLAFAMQGRAVAAGMTAGLSTVFHLVVGGWGCFAVFATMLLSRVPLRKLLGFALGAAPFILPLVYAVYRFTEGQGTAADHALMDQIYVTFAAPHCCDLSFLMSPERWTATAATFVLTPVLFFLRPKEKGGRMPALFVLVLIGLYVLGVVGQLFHAWWFLKLFPFQLANAIPLLFLFILTLAGLGSERPRRLLGKGVWVLAVVLLSWVSYMEDVTGDLADAPGKLKWRVEEPGRARSYGNRRVPMKLYEWIRTQTPKDAVFVTPHLGEFWVCAERAQVASMRHPPVDIQIIEWKERLIALNRGKPFRKRGFEIAQELDRNEGRLTIPELIEIRDKYGATHYLSERRRKELDTHQLFSSEKYYVYGLADLP